MKQRMGWMLAAALCLGASGGAQPWTESVKFTKDIPYVEGGGTRQMLDLYVPKDAGKAPLVVWIHGGGWSKNSKDNAKQVVGNLVPEGFAVACINYRYSTDAVYPAQLLDCKAAIRWLRDHAAEHKIDPDRIGVWGNSAGGHLAGLLGTTHGVKELEGDSPLSSKVQAVAMWAGPADLRAGVAVGDGEETGGRSVKTADMVKTLLGGMPDEKPDLAALASPAVHASADDPPFLIVQGAKDTTVLEKHAHMMKEALDKAGVPAELVICPDLDHNLRTDENYKKTIAFFKKILAP